MSKILIGRGVTDSNGIATMTEDASGNSIQGYTGTGAGEVDFSAGCTIDERTFQSEIFVTIDAMALDRATSTSKNDSMWISGVTGFTREETDTLCQLTEQKYTGQYSIGDGIKVEFECTSFSNGVMQIARYETGKSTTYHNVTFAVGLCSIECLPDVSYFKINGETVLTVNNSPNGLIRFFFNRYTPTGEISDFRFKNLRIYPI